jgi:hypothetical protein
MSFFDDDDDDASAGSRSSDETSVVTIVHPSTTGYSSRVSPPPRPSSSRASVSSSSSSIATGSATAHRKAPGLLPKKPLGEFTCTASDTLPFEATIPSTIDCKPRSRVECSDTVASSKLGKASSSKAGCPSSAVMKAMSEGFSTPTTESLHKKPLSSTFKHNLLASVAEDVELARSILDTTDIDSDVDSVKRVVGALNMDTKRIAAALQKAQAVALCFLVDTTGSMSSHIEGVKTQINDIVRAIHRTGCGVEGVAFVGYKDWCDGQDHFEVFDFSSHIVNFQSFIGRIRATGGGDDPEDVLGGIDRALSLSWPASSGCRVLFHIADAPPHGRQFTDMHDDYPSGHASDSDPKVLFARLKKLDIQYHFGKINSSCDRMLSIFETHYGRPVDAFDTAHASRIADSVKTSVMKSVSFASASASALSKGLRDRAFKIVPEEPDLTKIPQESCTLAKYDLPDSIKSIRAFEPF